MSTPRAERAARRTPRIDTTRVTSDEDAARQQLVTSPAPGSLGHLPPADRADARAARAARRGDDERMRDRTPHANSPVVATPRSDRAARALRRAAKEPSGVPDAVQPSPLAAEIAAAVAKRKS